METMGWSVREGKDRDGTARRQQLVDAARAVFEERGYGATRIEDITARAGVSRATFYVYFASKREVFSVLAEMVRDRYVAAQELAGINRDDVAEVLRRTIGTTLDVTAEHLALMTVLEHQALADPEIQELWGGIRREMVLRTARYLQREQRRGHVSPAADPETLAMMGAGMNDMFAPRVVEQPELREHAVEQMLAVVLATLGLPVRSDR